MKQLLPGTLCLFALAMMVLAEGGSRRAPGAEAWKTSGSELRYEEPVFLSGAIYSQPSKGTNLLFNFKRVASRSGTTLKVQRHYTYPDGRPAALERVVYEGDDVVSYELEELQTGGSGSAKIQRVPDRPGQGSIQFRYRKQAGDGPKTGTEALRENTLINDMVGPFLASHWDELARGDGVHCRLIVVPRRETVGFTFVKCAGPAGQGDDALTVKMEASSLVLAALVDPLFFRIDKAPPHRVRQYSGRTTPKIRVGSKWKDLDAVTVFDWGSAR